MALDLSTLADYSWSDIAKAAKVAMVNATLGGTTISIGGRNVGRVTPQQAMELYQFAQEMLASEEAGEQGGGNVLVNFSK